MKVKQVKEVDLTASEPFEIVLNDKSKNGDTVAKEIVLMADGSISIENDIDTQLVINQSTLDVEEYSEGWAIIPCEGISVLTITPSADCKLYYRVLV